MNQTTIRPTQARRPWLADEASATTTTTLEHSSAAEPDLTSGKVYETGLPARWNFPVSTIRLISSTHPDVMMRRDYVLAYLLISEKSIRGGVKHSIETLPFVYEISEDQFENQFKNYSDVFTSFFYRVSSERHFYHRRSALLKIQPISDDKRHICQWLDMPQKALESLFHYVSAWFYSGSFEEDKKDPPAWLKETEEVLRGFATLQEGWDSYGAKAIELQGVDSAIELLRRIVQPETPKPAVVPTNRGGIQIEWHTRGIDLEIEITPHGELRLLYVNPQENAEDEFEIGVDLKPVADLIAKVSPSR